MNIEDLMRATVELKASDLHISPGQPPIMRIHGELTPLKDQGPLTADKTKELVYSVFSQAQIKLFEHELEIDFAHAIPNVARFRVNAFHQTNGVAAVFRVIPEKIPTLDELELPTVFKQLLDLPNGLILVTGPTGSGKSTTLAAMISHCTQLLPNRRLVGGRQNVAIVAQPWRL